MKVTGKHEAIRKLLPGISSREKINEIVLLIGNAIKLFEELLQLSTDKDQRTAAMASWVARIWSERHPEKAIKYYKKIIRILKENESDPVTRNLSGLLIDLGTPAAFSGELVDLGFRLLSQKNRAVAVHANALSLITPFLPIYPELKKELQLITMHHPHLKKGSFQVRIKKGFSITK